MTSPPEAGGVIQHPALLLAAFAALVAALWAASGGGARSSTWHPISGRLFRFLPLPFWCYFLPMLGAALDLFPRANPLYGFLSQHLLPVCLVLLLLAADLRAIARLGPLALAMMLAGSAGTVIGGLASFLLYQRWLPEGAWGAVGALAGSWTGGSANLLAVKEALQVPDSLIGPIILVDAAVAYTWMALLIGSAGFQSRWERLVGPASGMPGDARSAAELARSPGELLGRRQRGGDRVSPARWGGTNDAEPGAPAWGRPAAAVVLAILISLMAQYGTQRLPALGAAMSGPTWTVLLVTTAALLLSMTPLRRMAESGGSTAGTFFLYVLLCSIGARGNLAAVGHAPVFLLLGATWIGIHGLVLLAAGALARAPLGLIATASQANIGGPISAPIVGATFSKPLAGVGLLMAILGNILGTYLGLGTALLARVAGFG